jgi:hypothetical protein
MNGKKLVRPCQTCQTFQSHMANTLRVGAQI